MIMRTLLCLGLICLTSTSFADVRDEVLDISGVTSNDFFGDPDNVVLSWELTDGNDYLLTGIGWDLAVSTISPSWGDEPRINIRDGAGVNITLGPFGSSTTGTFFSAGQINITPVVVTGGKLTVEFYETGFDDHPDGVDARYLDGSVLYSKGEKIGIPEPASLGLILAGLGLVCIKRRRA